MSCIHMRRLSDVAEVITGSTPRTDNELFWNGSVPFYSPADFNGEVCCEVTEKTVTEVGAKSGREIPAGAIMVTCIGTIGKIAISRKRGITNQQINSLLIKPGFDHRYVYYVVLNNIHKLKQAAPQTTIPILNKSDFGRFQFDFHDYGAQKKIAAVLSAADTAIEKNEALIDKYQQIKAGLMHDLFTRGVLPSGRLRPSREQAPELYREIAIGWIPKEWQYELLDRLALRGSGHTPNKDHPEYWNGGVKWVSLADSYRLDQLYISDTDLKISHKGIENSSAVLHPAGIVVLSRDAGIGKSAITTEPMAVSQHFMCWKCDRKMDNHFLYYWLQYNKRTFENIAMGSTILTIGLPYFKQLKVACPVDLVEQTAIASRLKSVDSHIFSLQRNLKKNHQKKLGLMQDLLTGKVPVKVDQAVAEAADG
jgi:type I restriction enzyme, S subunit